MAKEKKASPETLFNSLFEDISARAMDLEDYNIIEFSREVLGLVGNVQLWPSQRAILQVFYQLPLDAEAEAWLYQMLADNRTTWVPGRKYKTLAIEAGMRGSKSSLGSIIICYEAWKLYKMPDPAKHFNLMPGSPIFITSLATTQGQSKDTIFGATCGRLENSNYFQMLVNKGELIINSDRIEFPNKNITIIGGHSNQAALVGKSAKLFVMDEAARFKNKDTNESNARTMFSNVGKSVSTFKEQGFRVVISSAWEEGDIMEWLWDLADPDYDNQSILAFRLRTWDLNPNLSRESLDEFYREDETQAKRDYEGIRPGREDAFFNKTIIQRAVTGISVAMIENVHEHVNGITYVARKLHNLQTLAYPYYSFAHCDPGLVTDSFGLVVGHGEQTDHGIKAIIDLVIEWMPERDDRGNPIKVSFENVEELLLLIHKHRNIRKLTFDTWNSETLIQRLHRKGIQTLKVNPSNPITLNQYTITRQKFNAGLLSLPTEATKLVKEFQNIVLVNGIRIDHPKRNQDESVGSKDLSDCAASVVALIANEERLTSGAGSKSGRIHLVGQNRFHELNNPNTLNRVPVKANIKELFRQVQ